MKGSLRFGEMPYDIPLKVYDFIFSFLKLKKQPNFKEEEINKFFETVDSFPKDPIDFKLPNESRSEEEQAIIHSPNKYVTRFRNWNYFSFDREFRGCVINIAKNVKDYINIAKNEEANINLVRFYGPATQGFDYDNWYFYTERLEESLAEKLKNDELDEKEKLDILKDICQTVDTAVRTDEQGNDYFINCLNEKYIFAVKQGEFSEIFKILNHGLNLKQLEKLFPNQERGGNVSSSKLKDYYLVEDFLCMVFRMFKDRFEGENDVEIMENLQNKLEDPNEPNKDLYGFLNYAAIAYKNNLMYDNKKIDFEALKTWLGNIHSFNN